MVKKTKKDYTFNMKLVKFGNIYEYRTSITFNDDAYWDKDTVFKAVADYYVNFNKYREMMRLDAPDTDVVLDIYVRDMFGDKLVSKQNFTLDDLLSEGEGNPFFGWSGTDKRVYARDYQDMLEDLEENE